MRHKHTASRLLAIIALFVMVLFCVSAFAQETTGGVQGTVKDAQGAVVVGATVEVSGPALIGVKTATREPFPETVAPIRSVGGCGPGRCCRWPVSPSSASPP